MTNEQRKLIQKHVKIGNKKIGKDTLIFNMQSAHDCTSKKMGLCQLKNCRHCYAWIAEKQYPAVLPYRRRQAQIWGNQWQELSEVIAFMAYKNKRIKYVRFNESGDFTTQACVVKLATIARENPSLTFYGYTARKDLRFANRPKNLIVCGSGWRRGKMNQFNAVLEYTGKNAQCFGDCSKCNLCKVERGIVIENKMHGSRFNLLKGKN